MEITEELIKEWFIELLPLLAWKDLIYYFYLNGKCEFKKGIDYNAYMITVSKWDFVFYKIQFQIPNRNTGIIVCTDVTVIESCEFQPMYNKNATEYLRDKIKQNGITRFT